MQYMHSYFSGIFLRHGSRVYLQRGIFRYKKSTGFPDACTFKTAYKNILNIKPKSYLGYALDLLVTVSCMHCCTSTSVLSTLSSTRGLTTIVEISHLEGGFTLRCLQRLSRPNLATLLWTWQSNRCTSGSSTPVLSY